MRAPRWTFPLILGPLLLLGALAGPGAAQGQEPFYRIQFDPSTAQRAAIADRFGEATFSFQVWARPDQEGGFNNQVRIHFTIEDASGPVPQGWTVNIEPTERAVAPNERFVVTVVVQLVENQVAADRVEVRLRIHAEPQGSSPLTEQLIPNLFQPSQREAPLLTAQRSLSTPESITAFADQYKYFLLAGAAGMFLVAMVLVRKRREVSLSCAEPVQEVLPGRGASFPVRVINETAQRDRVYLTTSDLPPGWNVLLPMESLELHAGGTDTVWLTVRAPPMARPGERVRFEVFASSRSQPGREAAVPLEAFVVEHYSASPAHAQEFPEAPPAPEGPPPDFEIQEPEPMTPAPATRRPKASSKPRRKS